MEIKISLPTGQKQQFNFVMDAELHRRLMSEAEKRGVSAAELVRHVLRQVLPDLPKAA